jgi:hypothetical protein
MKTINFKTFQNISWGYNYRVEKEKRQDDMKYKIKQTKSYSPINTLKLNCYQYNQEDIKDVFVGIV